MSKFYQENGQLPCPGGHLCWQYGYFILSLTVLHEDNCRSCPNTVSHMFFMLCLRGCPLVSFGISGKNRILKFLTTKLCCLVPSRIHFESFKFTSHCRTVIRLLKCPQTWRSGSRHNGQYIVKDGAKSGEWKRGRKLPECIYENLYLPVEESSRPSCIRSDQTSWAGVLGLNATR
jgi:hypothetical protein